MLKKDINLFFFTIAGTNGKRDAIISETKKFPNESIFT